MDHREMKALADSADRVRALAGLLLKLPATDGQITWSDWELEFLEKMAQHQGPDPLSLRQAEKLVELNDDAKSYSNLDGLSVPALIDQCWIARLDLEEDDEAFIDRLKSSGARTLKRRQGLKLLACARQLGIVERYVALE